MTTWHHGEDYKGRVYDPGLPAELLEKQQVMANGAACGHVLATLAMLDWWDSKVRYPLDFFDPDEDPVFTPVTKSTREQDADHLPILAWAVSADGTQAAAVVDILEKSKYSLDPKTLQEFYPDIPLSEPVSLANCKVIGGTASDILPPEILERMRLG